MEIDRQQQIVSWAQAAGRRWLLVAIGMAALFVLAFYAVTDVSYLAHDHALAGADWVGYAVCHRISARSFMINGRQLPLCARCTGIYLGVFLAFLVIGLSGRFRWRDLPPLPMMLVLLAFVGVMGVDGLNSYSHFFENAPHLYEPRNWLRLLTGMGTGLAMGCFVAPALTQALWRRQVAQAAVRSWRDLAGLLLVGGTAVLLILSNQPTILYVLALVSAAGLMLLITSINTLMLLVLTRRDARFLYWRQAVPALALGLFIAVLQLSAISLLRFNLTGTMIGIPGL